MEDLESALLRHRPLVEKAARLQWARVKGRTWLGYEDLLQAGYVGLIEALRRFDPQMGGNGFLYLSIYGAIQHEVTENTHTLRVGNRFKQHASKIHASDDQDETVWAAKLGVTVSTVRRMKEYLATEFHSMDYPYDQEDGEPFTLHEITGEEDAGYTASEIREKIESACINDFDRAIVHLRSQGYTNPEIASTLAGKFTRSQEVKQVSETLRRIRKRMRKEEQA